MIIFIKKWNLLLLCAILIVSVLSIPLTMDSYRAVQTNAIPGFGKRIIIDAGHGEPDGGATGNSGVLEKELNLKVALKLQEFLEQSGMDVVVTRSDDNAIYDDSAGTIRQKKRTDLKNREKIMNESDADVFVSIHMNKFPDGQYSGPQVFYANNENSKSLATIIQSELIKTLSPPSKRAIKPSNNDIYLLKKATLPAVLVECGFLSNAEEEKLLLSDDYQKKIAWAIYSSIVYYFSNNNTQNTK